MPYSELHGNMTSCNFRACNTKIIDEASKVKNISGCVEIKGNIFYLVTRTVISFIPHVFGLRTLIINYSEICVANPHLDFVHSAALLLALLFIPNLFSHSSVQCFLFPRELFLPDGIYMSTSWLDFSSFFTTLFSSVRNKF